MAPQVDESGNGDADESENPVIDETEDTTPDESDHADAMVLYCKTMSKATTTTAATMVGVDRYGFEMSAQTDDGPRPIRLAFSQEVSTSDDIRKEMVAMVKKARELTAN